jgi:hypothetical protein
MHRLPGGDLDAAAFVLDDRDAADHRGVLVEAVRWPGSAHSRSLGQPASSSSGASLGPERLRMWATLTRASPVSTRPMYSSIDFGGSPAGLVRSASRRATWREGLAGGRHPRGGRDELRHLSEPARS